MGMEGSERVRGGGKYACAASRHLLHLVALSGSIQIHLGQVVRFRVEEPRKVV